MRRGTWFLIALAVAAGGSFWAAAEDKPNDRKQDEEAIRAAAKQYLTALERGDAKAAAVFWVPGGDIVDPSGRSRPASDVLAQETKPPGQASKPTVTVHSSIRFLTADSAVEDGTADATWPAKDARTPARGQFSAMWVKRQGKWLLASLREGRANSPPPPLSAHAQLAELEWMIGQWSGSTVDRTFDMSVNWNSTGTYLIRELRVTVKGNVVLAANQRIGWDPATHQIKAWTFDASGGHGEGVWTKQGNSWVAQATAVLADGKRTSNTNTYSFDGKNTIIWKSSGARPGESAPNQEIKLVRKAPAPSTTPAASTKPASSPGTAGKAPPQSADEAKKAEILNSARWRRAMFEMNEWAAAQSVYSKQQVERIKSDLARQVEIASARDLELILNDIDAKFKILETPQAEDTRAWLAHYLSILSDKRRDEIVKRLPNFATMTAEQLREELAKVEDKRASMARQRQDQEQYQPPTANPWDPGAQAALSAYYRDHSADVGGYASPYRSAPAQRPFSDVNPDQQDFHMYVGAYGGFGLIW